MSKETLEEASKDYIENTMKFSFNSLETKTQANRMLKCVEFGAKWQQERMYNKEDLISFAHFYFKEEFNSTMQTSKSTDEIFKDWFEQFKKK